MKKLRKRIVDRAYGADPPGNEVRTVEQLGPKQHMTPEGFLVCLDVPFARTGEMYYGPDETPISPGPDGVARVTRDSSALFHPETIASFVGKAVVDEHPGEDVTPANWQKYARGFAYNVRTGEGDDHDCLICDMMITDRDTIAAVKAMKREVSAGYEADYQQVGDGLGVQSNIIGNHIALVERGRCGPRCAIGDHSTTTEEGNEDMPATTRHVIAKPAAKPRAMISQRVLDAMALDAAEADEEGSAVHIHLHSGPGNETTTDAADVDPADKPAATVDADDPTEARFKKVEDTLSEMKKTMDSISEALKPKTDDAAIVDPSITVVDAAPDPAAAPTTTDSNASEEMDDEGKGKTNDSIALETSFKSLVADCEVLVPGFKVPTFDAKAKRKATVDAMCGARRKALEASHATSDGMALIEGVAGSTGLQLAGMACPAIANLFRASVGAKKLLNNRSATGDSSKIAAIEQRGAKAVTTTAQLSAIMKEHYKDKH